MPFLPPKQQCQSAEGNNDTLKNVKKNQATSCEDMFKNKCVTFFPEEFVLLPFSDHFPLSSATCSGSITVTMLLISELQLLLLLQRKYRIKFDGRGMRTVSGKLIAYTSSLRENVPVGTRVIGN